MSSLFYILRKSLKNNIKGLIRKPAALIAYIIIGGFFLTSFLFSGSGKEQAEAIMGMDTAKSIFMGYTIFLFVISLVSSLSGASLFRMSDVNMLFTAPLKAGYILIYAFVKQLGANLMVMLFLAVQYPNWKRSFGLIDGAGWILMVAYMVIVTLTSLLGMILYAYVSKKPQRVSWAKRIIYGLTIIFISPMVVNAYNTGNILDAVVEWLANDNLKFIPIIGWFGEVLMGVYSGINGEIGLYFSLIFGVIAIAFIYLYRMDTEFYEHVLSGTEVKEDMLQKAKKGKVGTSNINRKYRRIEGKFTLEGSLAIFQKHILEKRKKGFFLLPTRTIIMALGGAVAAISTPMDPTKLMLSILAAASYIMFIFTMAQSWENDLSYHYIYLIPATPYKKMLSSTLTNVISIFVEGILVLGVIGIILKVSMGITLSAIMAYSTLGMVFAYSDLVVRRMFGKIHGNVLRIFFRIFLLVLIIILGVIPAVITFLTIENYALSLSIFATINIILTLVFMWIGTGLFRSPELP